MHMDRHTNQIIGPLGLMNRSMSFVPANSLLVCWTTRAATSDPGCSAHVAPPIATLGKSTSRGFANSAVNSDPKIGLKHLIPFPQRLKHVA